MSEANIVRVTAEELEKQILEREGIQVILRCPRNMKIEAGAWPYQKAAQDKFSLAKFRDDRLVPHLRKGHSGKGVDFTILKYPVEDVTWAGRWKLANLRDIAKKVGKALELIA